MKLEERSSIYQLLASVYLREPDGKLTELFAKAGLDPKVALDDLAVEYTRLFIGPGKHIAPYESVHRPGDTGMLWGESTAAVKRFIEASGLKYKSTFTEMPDHIGAEFEFMQKLIALEAEGDKKSRQIQKKFFEEHLLRWVPNFCRKVKEEARLDFYKEAAEMTEEFMIKEKEVLSGE
jgi:TorA maturation chaperone TorD